jgi:hypothetical protein
MNKLTSENYLDVLNGEFEAGSALDKMQRAVTAHVAITAGDKVKGYYARYNDKPDALFAKIVGDMMINANLELPTEEIDMNDETPVTLSTLVGLATQIDAEDAAAEFAAISEGPGEAPVEPTLSAQAKLDMDPVHQAARWDGWNARNQELGKDTIANVRPMMAMNIYKRAFEGKVRIVFQTTAEESVDSKILKNATWYSLLKAADEVGYVGEIVDFVGIADNDGVTSLVPLFVVDVTAADLEAAEA